MKCAISGLHRHEIERFAAFYDEHPLGDTLRSLLVDRDIADLSVVAENLLEEALLLYNAAGRTSTDLEMELRRFYYPPTFETDDYIERGRVLREMAYAEFLQTPEWISTRRLALQRAGGRCQGCNTAEHLETHHRTYERRGEEELDDLTVLCAGCHTAVHLVVDGRKGKIRHQSRRPLSK